MQAAIAAYGTRFGQHAEAMIQAGVLRRSKQHGRKFMMPKTQKEWLAAVDHVKRLEGSTDAERELVIEVDTATEGAEEAPVVMEAADDGDEHSDRGEASDGEDESEGEDDEQGDVGEEKREEGEAGGVERDEGEQDGKGQGSAGGDGEEGVAETNAGARVVMSRRITPHHWGTVEGTRKRKPKTRLGEEEECSPSKTRKLVGNR